MRFCVLMGSPRPARNTAELCRPFCDELTRAGAQVDYIALAGLNIGPCRGCYACQNVQGSYGCVQHDDMYPVARSICRADCVVLATPIYTWYCPTEMKLVLDRHYGLNKLYGTATGNFLAGKSMALLLTHGYEAEYATSPFVTGMERFCSHSHMDYLGMYSVRDEDDLASFQAPAAVEGARAFARSLLARLG